MTRCWFRWIAILSMLGAGCDPNAFAPKMHGGDGGASSDGGPGGPGGSDGGAGDGSTGEDAGPPPKRSCGVSFSFKPASPVASVGIGGEFNGWKPQMTPMTGPDAMGNYTATVMLTPGAYGYKFVTTDGSGTQTWLADPANPYTKWVGGVENPVREVDDCNAPELVYKKLDVSGGTIHAEVQYVDGAAGAGLDSSSLAVLLDDQPANGFNLRSDGLLTVDASGLAKDKHRLIVRAADLAGHHAADLHVPFWIEDTPFDFRDGPLYFAFTDRFQNGDASLDSTTPGVDARANYQGGDWAGVKLAIDGGYFDQLGVRTIWLSPPNANPDGGFTGTGGHLYTGYHGYWPSDGRAPQKRFGSLDTLKALVKSAHAHGIRVIIDSVLNHVHQESPYWINHQNDGWFNPLNINGQSCVCESGGNGCGDWDSTQGNGNHGFLPRFTCWFEPYMPDLDYTNWDALTTMIDDALYWAREADIDGFRVDAVKHFLLTATTRLRGKLHDQFEHVGPLFYLVGETFTGDRGLIESFIGPNALHAQFDFPIYFTLRSVLADYSGSMRDLEGAAKASDAAFGDAPMSPFLGNHDVARFLSEAAGMLTSDPQGEAWSAPPGTPPDDTSYQKLQLALSFVLTSPGVPLIYYGDEIGMPGAADPDNRRFMKWSGYTASEQATLTHVQQLGAARKELHALQRGNRVTMWIDDNLYVFARVAGSDVAVVVINRQFSPTTVSVPVAPGVPLANGTVLKDRLGGPSVTVTNQALSLTIPAHSSAVLAP
jgi:glycosidase